MEKSVKYEILTFIVIFVLCKKKKARCSEKLKAAASEEINKKSWRSSEKKRLTGAEAYTGAE